MTLYTMRPLLGPGQLYTMLLSLKNCKLTQYNFFKNDSSLGILLQQWKVKPFKQ